MAKQQQHKTTIQKLEAVLPGSGAQMRAMAAPYEELARTIATAIAAAGIHAEKAASERTTLWDSFKGAIDVALTVGHNAGALQAGLSVACEEAGIPAGSYRGYSSTIVNLFTDLSEGRLDRAQVSAMSVKDARERYMDAEKKADKEMQAKLLAAYAKLTRADRATLVAELEARTADPVQTSKPAGIAAADEIKIAA